jgi:threonine aldolase
VAEITGKFDSVMFCLSKGLAAPVGSMLVGSPSFIDQARSVRKALGGGMRQAGVLAAAGLLALEEMPKRLHEDHANAKYLAAALADVPTIRVYPEKVQTNIVIFDVSPTGIGSSETLRRLRQRNLMGSTVNESVIRLLTHKDVSRRDCERAVEIIREVCK